MSGVRAKNGKVFITDVNGTVREITTFVDNVSHSLEEERLDDTRYGNAYKASTGGFIGWSGTITGKWESGGTTTPDKWFYDLITEAAGTVTSTLTYFPAGSASGLPYWAGTVGYSKYGTDGPYDNLVTWSAEFELATGGVTRGTV